MAFTRRRINLTFQLGKGNFGEDGVDTVELSGLRVSAAITKAGGVGMSRADLRVWGMPLELMNKLTVLNKIRPMDGRFNQVTVSAGDDESGVAVCYSGTIFEAWADMRAQPEAVFTVTAANGQIDALRPVPPTSYNGSVDAATVLAGIAAQMKPPRTFENSGVSAQLAYPYLAGTLREQALAVAKAGDFQMLLDDDVMAIWPKNGARDGLIALVSPETGMVGYPAFTGNGVNITMLYNPSIVFGRKIKVESQLTPANGEWLVANVNHDLESEMPGGKWFTSIEANLAGRPVPIIS